MKTRITGLLCVLLAAAMLLGACGKESQEDATAGKAPQAGEAAEGAVDDTLVIATVNGEPIYYKQFYPIYVGACEQNGISPDDATYGSMLKGQILEQLVNEKIVAQALTEKGFMEYTDEQLAKISEDAQAELDKMIDYYYGSQLKAELGEDYSEADYAGAAAKYEQELLDGADITKEEFVDYFKQDVAKEAAMKELTGDTAIRNVKQILFVIDSETQEAIKLLRDTYDASADILLESALALIEERANEALQKLESGALDFEAAMAEYNDPEKEPGNAYPVMEGTESYVKSFTAGAMALQSIGDFTGLVKSDYGYHIIAYVGDATIGTANPDQDATYEGSLSKLRSERWAAIQDEWIKAAVVTYTEEEY